MAQLPGSQLVRSLDTWECDLDARGSGVQLTTYLAVNTLLGSIWTGVRVAEGAGLENRYTGNGIVGSNPTLSVFVDSGSRERRFDPLPFSLLLRTGGRVA